jgi:hypothetical protein
MSADITTGPTLLPPPGIASKWLEKADAISAREASLFHPASDSKPAMAHFLHAQTALGQARHCSRILAKTFKIAI